VCMCTSLAHGFGIATTLPLAHMQLWSRPEKLAWPRKCRHLMTNAMAQPIRANRFSDTCRNAPAQMGAGADAENPLLAGERPILRWLVRMRLDTSGLPNPVNRKAVCKVRLPMQATLVRRAPQLAVGSLAATCQHPHVSISPDVPISCRAAHAWFADRHGKGMSCRPAVKVFRDNVTPRQPMNKPTSVCLQVYLRELQEEAGLTDAALRHIALVCGTR